MLAIAAPPGRAAGPPPTRTRLSITTGFDFSTGDYGEDASTDVWYVPFTVKVDHAPWILRVTVPYLRVSGPEGVVSAGDGSVIVGDAAGSRRTNDGLGDVLVGVTYVLAPRHHAMPFLELTGKVKCPTASRGDGLGTGEFDGSVQLDVSKSFGRLTPFATLGYRFVGDPPGVSLHHAAYASFGIDWRPADRWNAGLVYDWRQTASRGLGNAQQLMPYVSRRVGEHLSIGPYGVIGLSRAAADAGVGLQVTLRR